MATVALGHHFDPSLHCLKDELNPTLEYTVPYGLFGDKEKYTYYVSRAG